jgi:hypothetical protein
VDGTLLLEMSVWNKHATIPRELTRWYVYFVEGFNAIIGGANIGIKFDPKVYARGGGTSNVLNLDTYSSFNVFRRENERFAFWNAHFNCYPGSIYRNHRFAMNTIGLLGRPSMSVCCCCGALSGADRMLAFENGLPSGPPQQCSENPQPGSSKEKGSGKASYPPVWFRVPLALFLGIGSNGVLAWGLVLSDDWRIGRVILCALGIAMMLAGLSLALTLGIPATWGWWI